ncbi:Copia protein, partial [Cyphomyrmex costatus]
LSKGEEGTKEAIPYRKAVGSLIYIATVSRPDIMFAVSKVSRYLNCYNNTHWNAVKKIIRYLKGTKHYRLVYNKNKDSNIKVYSDADYAGCTDTRRSTTGYVLVKNGAAITWNSQRQNSVALSTMEAEFIAACAATKEAMWVKQFFNDINVCIVNPLTLYLDNQSAISFIKNHNYHKHSKHIEVKYNFVKEKYQAKDIDISFVSTESQLSDICTKALSRIKFETFRIQLGLQIS